MPIVIVLNVIMVNAIIIGVIILRIIVTEMQYRGPRNLYPNQNGGG